MVIILSSDFKDKPGWISGQTAEGRSCISSVHDWRMFGRNIEGAQ